MAEAPTIVPRGRVSDEQKLCLQRNAEFLKDEMDTEVLVSNLHTRLILDMRDMQDLSGISTQLQKNAMLLNIIAMRTPRGFEAFLSALQATGHQAAYERLTTSMADIRNAAQKKTNTQGPRNRRGSDVTDNSDVSREQAQGPVRLNDNFTEMDIMGMLHRLAIGDTDARNVEDGEGETLDKLQDNLRKVKSHLKDVRQELRERQEYDANREQELSQLRQQLMEASQEIARLLATDKVTSTKLADAQLKNNELLATVAELQSENESLRMRMERLEGRLDMFCGNLGQMQQIGHGLPALRQLGAKGTGRPGARTFQDNASHKPK